MPGLNLKPRYMQLLIVESPTKAKKIRGFLPSDFKVMASMGHIRDLPSLLGWRHI